MEKSLYWAPKACINRDSFGSSDFGGSSIADCGLKVEFLCDISILRDAICTIAAWSREAIFEFWESRLSAEGELGYAVLKSSGALRVGET